MSRSHGATAQRRLGSAPQTFSRTSARYRHLGRRRPALLAVQVPRRSKSSEAATPVDRDRDRRSGSCRIFHPINRVDELQPEAARKIGLTPPLHSGKGPSLCTSAGIVVPSPKLSIHQSSSSSSLAGGS